MDEETNDLPNNATCPECKQPCPEEDLLEFDRCFPCHFNDPANKEFDATN